MSEDSKLRYAVAVTEDAKPQFRYATQDAAHTAAKRLFFVRGDAVVFARDLASTDSMLNHPLGVLVARASVDAYDRFWLSIDGPAFQLGLF